MFSQGRISLELLLRDKVFRESSIEKIKELHPEYGEIINLCNYILTEMTIVFVIIDKNTRELHERLPFFSKLNMMQAAIHLRGLGYKVLKTQILQENE